MKKLISILLPLIVLALIGCSNQQSLTQPAVDTVTPDPCSSQNLPTTVEGINDLMREFDDASELASNLPIQQLPDAISNMQRIRRAAEDLQTPACLTTLRTHQLNHMNGVIQTLLSFVGGADQETINKGLTAAREDHDRYSLEIVRLLGITLSPVTAVPPVLEATETPAVSVTP